MKEKSNHMGIKMASWFAIFFIASMGSGGNMSFGLYAIVVFLCFFASRLIDRIANETAKENEETDDDKTE